MRNIWTIAKRDFLAYFTSPVAYIVLTLLFGMSSFMFYQILKSFMIQSAAFQSAQMGQLPSLTDAVANPTLGSINTVLLFVFPLITMRLVAEERKNETLPLILTSPITLLEFILGKFLSSLMFLAILLGVSLVYPAILFAYGNPELGPILGAYLGTLLMVGCYLSIGLLFSAMTDNQLVAAALTFGASLMFWIISWAAQSAGSTLGDVLNYLSLINHYQSFARGTIVSSDVLYFLSFITVGIFLTHRVLDSYRWR
ncbi:MAG: ABC transporter permease subunit [Oligoflexia bacterium]|jgi:ABC-2 type transport system permease protein